MNTLLTCTVTSLCITATTSFWDLATTTPEPAYNLDMSARSSFFKWEEVSTMGLWELIWRWITWNPERNVDKKRIARRLRCMVGISIDFMPLGTGVLLNRRVVLSSANFLEPHQNRIKDVRLWSLGRNGDHISPYRYRVWRARRLLPKSNNPEHKHGAYGTHVPRHDLVVIHSMDQMYIYWVKSTRFHYPYRAILCTPRYLLKNELWLAGSGYYHLQHIRENYYITFAITKIEDIVDCSIYLPKWWGKFICIVNVMGLAGVASGSGLFVQDKVKDEVLVGIGCFEIRYNEQRIMVFTDLRYYARLINIYANITPGEYYEYAYPEYGVTLAWWFFYEGHWNNPYIPNWQVRYDMFPLGKK